MKTIPIIHLGTVTKAILKALSRKETVKLTNFINADFRLKYISNGINIAEAIIFLKPGEISC